MYTWTLNISATIWYLMVAVKQCDTNYKLRFISKHFSLFFFIILLKAVYEMPGCRSLLLHMCQMWVCVRCETGKQCAAYWFSVWTRNIFYDLYLWLRILQTTQIINNSCFADNNSMTEPECFEMIKKNSFRIYMIQWAFLWYRILCVGTSFLHLWFAGCICRL